MRMSRKTVATSNTKEKIEYGLLQYTRSLLQEDFFPSISKEGHVYETTGTGHASVKNRKYKTHDSDSKFMPTKLQAFMNSHFPQGHLHYTTAPEIRALKHRPKGQMTLTFTASSKEMAWGGGGTM